MLLVSHQIILVLGVAYKPNITSEAVKLLGSVYVYQSYMFVIIIDIFSCEVISAGCKIRHIDRAQVGLVYAKRGKKGIREVEKGKSAIYGN